VLARALYDGPASALDARSAACWRQIFDAYCSKKSLTRDNVRFLFDGQRINPTSSPLDVRARFCCRAPLPSRSRTRCC
jgi:hypothetical protein